MSGEKKRDREAARYEKKLESIPEARERRIREGEAEEKARAEAFRAKKSAEVKAQRARDNENSKVGL